MKMRKKSLMRTMKMHMSRGLTTRMVAIRLLYIQSLLNIKMMKETGLKSIMNLKKQLRAIQLF